MNQKKRRRCAVCTSESLARLETFRRFPILMGCSTSDPTDDVFADMRWMICGTCGLIQLGSLIPLHVLYSASHGSGNVGAVWQQHHKEFALFLRRLKPSSVLEIGGAHGLLSIEYHQLEDIPWHIVEPNPTPAKGCRAEFKSGFFDRKIRLEIQYDAVVHSHVLEHIYEPIDFISLLKKSIRHGGFMCFSFPNMMAQLERKYTNCLGFEHTIFLTEPYVDYLLAAHGFVVLDKEYYLDDHSIFYATQWNGKTPDTVDYENLFDKYHSLNKSIFNEFVSFNRNIVVQLNANLQKLNLKESEVYIFGAHIFSQSLLAFGLEKNLITGVLDNDPTKRGKRLYGTDLIVDSPQILASKTNPVVIVKAGPYTEEIKRSIEYINCNTVIIS
jgi:hypothetical protein